jgi:hypothetical protein
MTLSMGPLPVRAVGLSESRNCYSNLETLYLAYLRRFLRSTRSRSP